MWNDSVIELVRTTARRELRLGPLGLPGISTIFSETTTQRRAAIRSLLRVIKYQKPQERDASIAFLLGEAGLQPASLPNDLMMTSDQIRALRGAGMQIGAHTVNHPILATLSADEARMEIAESRDVLQRLLSEPIDLFAYPNGKPNVDYTERDCALVRDLGFSAAVSTSWGVARAGADLHQLPRFTPWDWTKVKFGLRLARNFYLRGAMA
jgi:hypothetical protein